MKKQELVKCIEDHIHKNLREILEHMPYNDFCILQDISQEEPYIIDNADESSFDAVRYLLETGLIFALEQPVEEYELFFPLKKDFIQGVLNQQPISDNRQFILCQQIQAA